MDKKGFIEIVWPQYFTSEESEILISFLDLIGFEAFHEDDGFFRAYVDVEVYNSQTLSETLSNIPIEKDLTTFKVSQLPDKNWNEAWESEFTTVQIGDFLKIRAPFHTIETRSQFEIIIEPKMSFGTGHHETTSGMLEMMYEIDFTGKSVIDMGSGTGILSVFAEKLGAASVIAIDNDPVCIENSREIIELNSSHCIKVLSGESSALEGLNCDILLANINRNILLNDIKEYKKTLKVGGLLMMSGFYSHDLGMIHEECILHGFQSVQVKTKNNWIICLYKLI
jgi:ribosomal protein L11 methyltransferase